MAFSGIEWKTILTDEIGVMCFAIQRRVGSGMLFPLHTTSADEANTRLEWLTYELLPLVNRTMSRGAQLTADDQPTEPAIANQDVCTAAE